LSETDLTKLRRSRVGFVFQAFNLVSALTVRENIALPSRLARNRPDRRWLTEVVARLGLGERLRHRSAQLSGGEQRRVAIARALAVHPGSTLSSSRPRPPPARTSRRGCGPNWAGSPPGRPCWRDEYQAELDKDLAANGWTSQIIVGVMLVYMVIAAVNTWLWLRWHDAGSWRSGG
jgi:ABC transporter